MVDDKSSAGIPARRTRTPEGPEAAATMGSRRLACATFTVLFLVVGLGSLATPAQVSGGDTRVDLSSARQEIQAFEKVINKFLGEEFANSVIAVQKSKGVYLQGYGVTFTFLVNIHRAVINTPFGGITRQDADTPEQKKRRIEEMKEKLVRLLQSYGDTFRQVRRDEYISIVVFVEDRNFLDEENQNKTLVLTVLKRDAEELARREDRAREFKQRMRIVEY
jgi:hypothetical protein